MNERIKELAKESGVIFVPSSTDYLGEYFPSAILTDKMDLGKFAELIVRECADYIQHFYGDIAASSIGNDIKLHFGIEE